MTPSAPQAAGRLIAVCSDVAELLAVWALRKTILSSTYLHSDCDAAEACRRKMSWDFVVLVKVIRKRGRFMIVDPSEGDRRVVVICLTLITSNPRFTILSDISSLVGGVAPPSYVFLIWGRRSNRTGYGHRSGIWWTGNPSCFLWRLEFNFGCYRTQSFLWPQFSVLFLTE
jgi:hypothetical protein